MTQPKPKARKMWAVYLDDSLYSMHFTLDAANYVKQRAHDKDRFHIIRVTVTPDAPKKARKK